MGTIIASLAIFVALIALWLASANIKKIEIGNKEVKAQLTSDIAKMKRELERQIESLDRKVGAFSGKMDALTQGQAQTRETVTGLEKDLAKTTEQLKDLINSIPPQYRQNRTGAVKSGFG